MASLRPNAQPSHVPLAPLRLAVIGGWLLFTLMVIAITSAGNMVRGRPVDLGGMLLWNLGWIFWAGASFGVAALVRRFPLERPRLGRGIARHCGLGIAVGLALLALEFLFNHALGLLWSGAPRANPFLGFVVYKFHVYFLIYWMVLGATRAYDYHTQFRATALRASQLEAELAHAQLHVLQAQLQPHFLFNTHHAIIALMLKGDNVSAIKMLTRLSDLLRVTLRHPDRQVTTLREELDALELYLAIQRERYGDRLRVERDIDPAALDAEVPWLLLQPLVENALKHGIDSLATGGVLRIQAHLEADQLRLAVLDNGPGFPPDFDLTQTPAGIGLTNTRARLARLYGPAHQLEIGRSPGGGAALHLALPLAPQPFVATTSPVASIP